MPPLRAIILGTSGSGKTTFARRLAALRGCAFIDLDDLHWEPGWKEAGDEVLLERVRAAMGAPEWAMAGSYLKLRHETWPQAQQIVWLDYSFSRVMWQVVWRTVRRAIKREVICNGNRESWRMSFLSRDSVILWAMTTYGRRQQDYEVLFAAPPHPHLELIRVRTPAEAEALLKRLAALPT